STVPSAWLQEPIQEIRAAKTQAREREVIQKECAHIRAASRDGDTPRRHYQLAELLYVHRLGYPAHFGQMECLKPIASPRFTDKRVGYLGAVLLLDERRDAHLLIANSIKKDLCQGSPPVQGLAPCTLSAVGSAETCRDPAPEVERPLLRPAPYVRKKAVLAAVHVVRKAPELSEVFLPPCAQLLHERPGRRHRPVLPSLPSPDPGILLGTVTLITELCESSPPALKHFRKVVPQLVQILQTLVMSGYSTEHSLSDPFLQVRLLRLLRILGRNHEESSEVMNDPLAQVATSTDTSRNAGNAVLYETVLTTVDIRSASGPRVLAVNILGRFLLNKDKNIRWGGAHTLAPLRGYVALTSLPRLVPSDRGAVRRHRPTVVEPPGRPRDRRGRGRAAGLPGEPPPDPRADRASGILLAAEGFAPSERWHVDTVPRVLTTAGAHVRDDAVASLTQLIGGAEELRAYSVRCLCGAPAADISQQPLVQVAAWCIGEFGDPLLDGSREELEPPQVEEDAVLALLEKVLRSHLPLPAGAPLLPKGRAGGKQEARTCPPTLREAVLEKIPLPERGREDGEPAEALKCERMSDPLSVGLCQASDLLDLLDLLDSPPGPTPRPPAAGQPAPGGSPLHPLDLPPPPPSSPPLSSPSTGEARRHLRRGGAGSPPRSLPPMARVPAPPRAPGRVSASAPAAIPGLTVFERAGLRLDLASARPAETPALLLVTATATNTSPGDVTRFVCQAAVPGSLQLQLEAPSADTLPRVLNPNKAPLRMRLRLAYDHPGHPVQELCEVNGFPPATWQ
uniref:AP-1 complex subunit gamma n=1 Tax=Ornithorhynchus anatinus TaxID=9258 RepID=A0A6I8N9U7_ORNAN